MGTEVIIRVNSAPILESAKHDFYFVPLFIKLFVIGHRSFPTISARNTRRDSFTGKAFATSRHHSLYPPRVPWPMAEKQARQGGPCNHSSDRRSDGTLSVDRRHCKRHGVLNSSRPLCVRYIGTGPFFQQTRCCPVGLEMGGVNHQACL